MVADDPFILFVCDCERCLTALDRKDCGSWEYDVPSDGSHPVNVHINTPCGMAVNIQVSVVKARPHD